MTSDIEELRKQLEQEKTLKEMYFTYYKAKHGDIKGLFFRHKHALAEIKKLAIGIRNYAKDFTPKDVREEMDTILQLISEVENAR